MRFVFPLMYLLPGCEHFKSNISMYLIKRDKMLQGFAYTPTPGNAT